MRKIIIASLLCLSSFSANAYSADLFFFQKNGVELLENFRAFDNCQIQTMQSECTVKSLTGMAFLQGYLAGFADLTFDVICADRDVSIDELSLVVRRYLEDHQNDLYQPAPPLIVKALSKKYPCHKS